MAFPKWISINLLGVLLVSAACSSGPIAKSMLDDEVRRLCGVDGGISVYETVALPSVRFNQWGQINFYRPTQKENSLGDEYLFWKEEKYFKHENPEMWRTHIRVIRKSDGKLLGESISYSRRGGDMAGPWHESSFGCPEDRGDMPLFSKIFHADLKPIN